MDFEDQAQPKTQKLELNFEDHGYALVLVKVGADHVAATDDYAAVPREMQDVAAEFGKARLCEVNIADFDAKLPELRAKLSDRACLRAVHYWYENGLVDKRWAALNAGDIDQFLVLTRESGASSAMYLQNVVAKLDLNSLPCMPWRWPSTCSTAAAPFAFTVAALVAPSRPSCRSTWSTPSLPR